MKITIIGAGYVGYSLAILLARKYSVMAYDIDNKKVELINSNKPLLEDNYIKKYLKNNKINLKASDKLKTACSNSEYIVICTPTNYDKKNSKFDTSSVQELIKIISKEFNKSTIIIKSTIPIGFTDFVRKKYKNNKIYFSPEFLRENMSLYDNQFPSRIIIGGNDKRAIKFCKALENSSYIKKNKIPTFFMNSKEAEAVKLFANTYLALRISFFNELDSFAEFNQIDTKNIIEGMSSDPRIGNYYNNPSFGYGGYCLPKDSKQLKQNFKNIPNSLINAVVMSNAKRKQFIAKSILQKAHKTIGIYRLIMKSKSVNFRESAIFDILKIIGKQKVKIIIYEPLINNSRKLESYGEVVKNLKEFLKRSDVIVANRYSKELSNVNNKVYTRDIFNEN